MLAAALGLLPACSTPSEERATQSEPDAAAEDDASTRGPPMQDVTRRLTLFPFWELVRGDGGLAWAPLDGVIVCVTHARRHGASGADFVETPGLCSEPSTRQKVVIDGIPPLSELLVTATKEGYRPRALALVSHASDLDLTSVYPGIDLHEMNLAGGEGLHPGADPELGSLDVLLAQVGFAAVEGAQPALEPEEGTGPYYSVGGRIDPLATGSLPGAFVTPAGGATTDLPLTSFIDLPGREYLLRVLPAAGVRTRCYGNYPGDELGSVRVPVLAGHTTQVVLICSEIPWGADSGGP